MADLTALPHGAWTDNDGKSIYFDSIDNGACIMGKARHSARASWIYTGGECSDGARADIGDDPEDPDTHIAWKVPYAEKNLGKSGQDPYSDRMVVHDEQSGQMLTKLDELGIADNTIVMYSTDNGPENDTWPDGANSPFRGQKNSGWEGGWRVPCFMRWPGKIKPGSVLNGIVSHIDMFPTLLAAAGNPDVAEQLVNGCTVDGKQFHVHLDGLQPDPIPYRRGHSEPEAGDRILQR